MTDETTTRIELTLLGAQWLAIVEWGIGTDEYGGHEIGYFDSEAEARAGAEAWLDALGELADA